jgi:hypothetical protein
MFIQNFRILTGVARKVWTGSLYDRSMSVCVLEGTKTSGRVQMGPVLIVHDVDID